MMSPIRTKRYRLTRWILIAYWGSLFIATHIPAKHMPAVKIYDKFAHTVAYFILAILLCLHESQKHILAARQYTIIFITLVLYGFIDEVLQIPVNRRAEWGDWTADILGILLAIVVYWTYRHQRPLKHLQDYKA